MPLPANGMPRKPLSLDPPPGLLEQKIHENQCGKLCEQVSTERTNAIRAGTMPACSRAQIPLWWAGIDRSLRHKGCHPMNALDMTALTHATDPQPTKAAERIALRPAELGEGLTIRRALPTRQRRMVGAWCFLDHIGPVAFSADQGMHVGAHPHTGLQTFTWMMEGQILHRDSLGSEQLIRPGQVNLMTAGRGIAHTEDSMPGPVPLHAAQLWIALPPDRADTAPTFQHYPCLPSWQEQAVEFTLLVGDFAGRTAPTQVHSPLVGLDMRATFSGQASLALNPGFEYGLLPLQGRIRIGAEWFDSNDFAFLGQHLTELTVEMEDNTRVLLVGGEPFATPITMWWNFVGPSREYVTQAQAEWDAGGHRFGPVAGGEKRRLAAPPTPWERSTDPS